MDKPKLYEKYDFIENNEYSAEPYFISYRAWIGGKKTGIWKRYYAYTTKLREIGEYFDDKRHGVWVWYDTNGNYNSGTKYDMGKEIIYNMTEEDVRKEELEKEREDMAYHERLCSG